MRLLYSFVIWFYGVVARIIAIRNHKAKLWVNGRKGLLSKIQEDFKGEINPVIWFHSASLGEFEQGRPLIEKFKKEKPEYKILLTFYSPSGYEVRKDYALADYIYYLPEDASSNAKKFLDIVNPKAVVFIKYEFWYNYLNQLQKAQIPSIFISSIFRPKQSFFQFYGGWFLKHLRGVNYFFVQNETSKSLLEEVGISQVRIAGDTRFDRVAEIAEQVNENKIVQEFKDSKTLFLGGSTWPQDELLISYVSQVYKDLKIVIAPHLIDESHIQEIEKLFPGSLRYSMAEGKNLSQFQILIIDNMGLLSSLYQYADYAMIGGGFGAGIHNTLEAATFGMPIFIGPNYKKFQEAKDLIERGVIQVVHSEDDLLSGINKYQSNEDLKKQVAQKSRDYVLQSKGASQLIFDYISTFLKNN